MLRKNVYTYLEKFTDAELKQLRKYIESPFFKVNSRKRVLQIFDYLMKYHPNFEHPKLELKTMQAALKFGNITNLKTVLMDCVEDLKPPTVFRLLKKSKVKGRKTFYTSIKMQSMCSILQVRRN